MYVIYPTVLSSDTSKQNPRLQYSNPITDRHVSKVPSLSAFLSLHLHTFSSEREKGEQRKS